ncbi:MAG: hypothetical protein KDJ77_20325, partial [Rhodobiaceae bacterium]|nr:hypothetical protein [Rhodobiaceae bacterium]
EAAGSVVTIDPVAGAVATTGEQMALTIHAGHPAGLPLVYSVTGGPAGLAIAPTGTYGEALLTLDAVAGNIGEYTLTISVAPQSDPGQATTLTLPLSVRAANSSPVLEPIGTLHAKELETLDIQLAAIDPDGDPLTWSASGLPTGASIDPLTGRIVFTPHSFQAGVYEGIDITVSDGQFSMTETIAIEVADTNRAPVFVQMGDQSGREGTAISFRLLAGDIDGDAVRFAPLTAMPAGARFDGATGVFTWTPGYEQAGQYVLRFAALDSAGGQTQRDVVINIANVNRAPELTVENQAVALGETLDIVLTAGDPDSEDTPQLSIENLPAGATFDSATGRFTFSPDIGQIGDLVVRVAADDGQTRTVVPMVVRVTREPEGPVAILNITPSFPSRPGQTIVISTIADGFVPVASRHLFVNGSELALDSLGRASFTAGAPGKLEAVLIVTDIAGRTTEVRNSIAVRDPSDMTAPSVLLDIVEGAQLEDGAITGRIADAGLDSWVLTLVHAQSGREIELATGTDPLDGVLADWNSGAVLSGYYKLRLSAVDLAGLRTVVERSVEVLPHQPLGFRHSVTDATVDIDGVSLDLTRIYDSRPGGEALTASRFGEHWRAAWTDLEFDSLIAGMPDRALQAGTRLHLTAPDGTRLVFTATFETVEVAGVKTV